MFERQCLFVSRSIPARQDIVFQKRRPDASGATDFDLVLKSRGIGTILVGGVATEGGFEGTARTARNLGYDVVVLRDCVGSRSRDLHKLAVKLMEQTHFNVVTGKEIADVWDKK